MGLKRLDNILLKNYQTIYNVLQKIQTTILLNAVVSKCHKYEDPIKAKSNVYERFHQICNKNPSKSAKQSKSIRKFHFI